MARCDECMKSPVHPDKKCCFNCARVGADCEVWHNCGEDCPGWETRGVTNGDKIRAMTNEELAIHLFEIGWECHRCSEHERLDNNPLFRGEKCDENCVTHCLEWLKQPAEEDDGQA